MSIKDNIIKTVNENCVVMYSKGFCSYCRSAKKILQEVGVDFLEIDISRDPQGSNIQSALREITGGSTVPRVFIGGKCIGGGDETNALHRRGELKKMIDQCSK